MFIEAASSLSEIVVISVSVLVVLGHNLWLVAKDEPGEIKIEVVTSDVFPESDSAVKPERVKDFRVFTENDSTPITNYRIEENSLVAPLEKAGKHDLVALELHPHPIVLEAEKFAGYIESEAAENRVAAHFAAGETERAQRESYQKFAKVLLDNDAFALTVGHRLEIVLQTNPSQLAPGEKLKIKVTFDGAPVENLRVSTGAENLNDSKYAGHARTDENGSAEIEIIGAGLCFLRTHFIRPSVGSGDFDWESFWASVTFRI